MRPTVTITAEDRDALYGQVLDHLSGLGDLWIAVENKHFKTAERLRGEVIDELRLLGDLGWGESSAGEPIGLTMPPEDLRRLFTRLHADVEGLRKEERRHKAELENETRKFRDRAIRVAEVCERVMRLVGTTPSPYLADQDV